MLVQIRLFDDPCKESRFVFEGSASQALDFLSGFQLFAPRYTVCFTVPECCSDEGCVDQLITIYTCKPFN